MQPFSLSAVNYSIDFLLEASMEVMENKLVFHQSHASEVFIFIFVSSKRFCTAMKQTQIPWLKPPSGLLHKATII